MTDLSCRFAPTRKREYHFAKIDTLSKKCHRKTPFFAAKCSGTLKKRRKTGGIETQNALL
jgi:hypothetical protein